MKRAILFLTMAMAVAATTGCSAIVDSMFDSAFGSPKDRRAEYYESKGIEPKRASRMAFEDEVWSGRAFR